MHFWSRKRLTIFVLIIQSLPKSKTGGSFHNQNRYEEKSNNSLSIRDSIKKSMKRKKENLKKQKCSLYKT